MFPGVDFSSVGEAFGLLARLVAPIDFPVFNFLKSDSDEQLIEPTIPAPEPQRVVPGPSPSPAKLLHVGKEVVTGQPFAINPAEYAEMGTRDAIFAQSGMGKSYLTGVLLEQELENKGLVYVVDPEGEYYTLADRYPILIVGGDEANTGLNLETATAEDFRKLSETILLEGASVVLDLSDFEDDRQQELFTLAAGSLFNVMNQDEFKRPIKVVVEEADIFAPQNSAALKAIDGKTSLSVMAKLAKRGRKRGADLLTATQRPATLHKNAVSQANRIWFGGIKAEQDYKALKPHLERYGITAEQIRTLQRGQFYVCGKEPPRLIQVGKRKCRHGGKTPEARKDLKIVTSRAEAQKIAGRL